MVRYLSDTPCVLKDVFPGEWVWKITELLILYIEKFLECAKFLHVN